MSVSATWVAVGLAIGAASLAFGAALKTAADEGAARSA